MRARWLMGLETDREWADGSHSSLPRGGWYYSGYGGVGGWNVYVAPVLQCMDCVHYIDVLYYGVSLGEGANALGDIGLASVAVALMYGRNNC
jgi:hypothetical protein